MLDLILLSGSKISRIEGKRLYQNKLVSDIKGKKIESIYHIYGKVKDEKIDKYYNVHIKVDLRNKKMAGGNCSCEDYIENKNLHRDFKCKHVMAVAYKFYMLAKKDKKKKGTKEPIKIEKIQVRIEPRLKAIKENGIEKYIAEFWIGDNSLALMKSINEFIYCMENKRFLSLNDNFVYNPHKHILNEEAERIISYINKKISSKDSKEKRIIGRYFEIKAEDLKEFLMLLEDNKSIFFNYDYVNYKAEVIKEMLPIHFNIKIKEEKISVTTTNKMPIPLNNSLDAFLYDRKIYVPNEEQIKFLKVIYKPLMDKGQVILANNEENLVKILRILSNITEDISLGEGVKRLVTSLIKPEFYFTKVNDDIYCKVDINYSIGKITLLKDINKLSFIRDNIYEEKIVMEMEKLKFIRDDSKFKFIGEDEDIYNLLSVRFKELLKEGKVYLTKDFKDIRLIKGKDLDYSFIEEDEGYYFKVKGFTIKELNSALHDMKNKKGFYKTKNNNYLDLQDKTVIRILNILDSLDISDDNITIDKNNMLYINESLKNQGTAFDKGEETIKEIDKGLSNRKQREVPDDLNAKLRNYQVEGFNWLNEIANLKVGGILADEMGLGKTIQIIAFLLSQKGKKSIVITPTSLIYNWRDEFKKFAPSLKVGIIHGDKKNRVVMMEKDFDVIVTTYGLIKNDYEYYKEKEFDFCIIDEAQNIKNSKAQNTKYVKAIKAGCRIALSGTPMENNLMELWSIFDYIMPGYLLSEAKFKEKYLKEDMYDELKELIKPFILRRLKKDVIDELPNKIEKKFMVEMEKNQKAVYQSYIKEVRQKLYSGEDNKITVFSYLTKLRQLCLDPSLILDDYVGRSAKIEAALNIVNMAIAENRKVLIFSQFTSVLQKLGDELSEKNIGYLYLDGSTKANKRVEMVKEFNESEELKIFLISLKAGGTGLNLTSSDLVLHFDPWWNPAIEDQATDRAHRIGQQNIVEVIKLIAKDSVEENIIRLQEDKRELINKVISGEEIGSNVIGKLSRDEIIDLFS